MPRHLCMPPAVGCNELHVLISTRLHTGAQCYSLRDNYRSTPQVLSAALAVLPSPQPLQPLRSSGVPVQVHNKTIQKIFIPRIVQN